MSRAYTAWVIQNGKGDDSEYVRFGEGSVSFTSQLRRASQFARRTDARAVLDNLEKRYPGMYIERAARPVEKTFG
jgi:hypothetical protein